MALFGIVNWALRNKVSGNWDTAKQQSIEGENEFENVICKMAPICLGLNVLTQLLAT